MNRVEILSTAESLINGDREKDYGSARDNFTRIGNLWAEIFGHPVTPEQVALAMNQVKVARLVVTPDHKDSWIDGAGYFALGGEIATEPEPRREPRVVNILTPDCRDAEWLRDNGELGRYRWSPISEFWERLIDSSWVYGGADPGFHGGSTFTEVIE